MADEFVAFCGEPVTLGQAVQADHCEDLVTVVVFKVNVLVICAVLLTLEDTAVPPVGPTGFESEVVSLANGALEADESAAEEESVPIDTPVGEGGGNEKGGHPVPSQVVLEVSNAGSKVVKKLELTSNAEQIVLSQVIDTTSALRFCGRSLGAKVIEAAAGAAPRPCQHIASR